MALRIAKISNPNPPESLEVLGVKAFAAGDLDSAASHLLSALEHDDANGGLFLKLGAVFLQQGRVDKALIAFKRSIELAPYDADAYNALGSALFHLEFWGAAEAFYRRALELDARHATAKGNLVEARKRLRSGDALLPPEFDSVMALLEKKDPTLSLCMIVKNEELFIGDCLASVRDLVDEIIVVDTGSTDRTIEIAESFGAKVFHHPWQGDFATARNVSLDHASGDWILVLDADEIIPGEGHVEIRQALRHSENVGYALIIENLLGDVGSEYQTALIFRLFRNRPDIRYEGIIHEQAMLAAQRTGLPVQNLTSRIIHRGYLEQHVEQRNKYQRNLEILLRQVEIEPENPYVFFNLGQTYKLLDRMSESEQAYLRCLSLLDEQQAPPTTPYWVTAYFSLADLYRMTGEIEKGLKVADEALARYPDSPDVRFTRGLLLVDAERYPEAIEDFQACRATVGNIYAWGNDPSVPTYKSSQGLGVAYSRMGQHAIAKQHYLKAHEEWANPNEELFINLGIVHSHLGEQQAAMSYFIQAVEKNERNAKAWGNLAHVCQQLGQQEEAVAALRNAYALDAAEYRLPFGMALLHGKLYPEAERVLLEQTELQAAVAPAWIYLGLAQLCLGKQDEARLTWNTLMERSDMDAQTRADASSLLRFVAVLAESSAELEASALEARDGEYWVLVLSHLIRAERYSEVERALQYLATMELPGLDLALGRMLAQHGLRDEALPFLLKAREQSPESVEIYVLLGEVAEELGSLEDAQVMYQMAVSLDPKRVDIRQRLGRLRLEAAGK